MKTKPLPLQIDQTPRHRQGDKFVYSFTFLLDDNPLDLTAFDNVFITLFSDDKTVFKQNTNESATISGEHNNFITGEVSADEMNVPVGDYYIDVYIILNGGKRTYVSSPFKIKGPGKPGTAHNWVISI